jgi:hypothetical protein
MKAGGRGMMKLDKFSFRNEGMWLTITSFALPVLAVIIYLMLLLVRYLRG